MEPWREEVRNNYLMHYGTKNMRWGFSKGQRNGNRTKLWQDQKARVLDSVVEEAANRTIRGDYGNGADRQRRLGKGYETIQTRVNEKVTGKTIAPRNYLGNGERMTARHVPTPAEAAKAAPPGQKTIARRKAALAEKEAPTQRVSSYNRGYAFAQKIFGKKKKATKVTPMGKRNGWAQNGGKR